MTRLRTGRDSGMLDGMISGAYVYVLCEHRFRASESHTLHALASHRLARSILNTVGHGCYQLECTYLAIIASHRESATPTRLRASDFGGVRCIRRAAADHETRQYGDMVGTVSAGNGHLRRAVADHETRHRGSMVGTVTAGDRDFRWGVAVRANWRRAASRKRHKRAARRGDRRGNV